MLAYLPTLGDALAGIWRASVGLSDRAIAEHVGCLSLASVNGVRNFIRLTKSFSHPPARAGKVGR